MKSRQTLLVIILAICAGALCLPSLLAEREAESTLPYWCRVPDFTLELPDGQQLSRESLLGNVWILLGGQPGPDGAAPLQLADIGLPVVLLQNMADLGGEAGSWQDLQRVVEKCQSHVTRQDGGMLAALVDGHGLVRAAYPVHEEQVLERLKADAARLQEQQKEVSGD